VANRLDAVVSLTSAPADTRTVIFVGDPLTDDRPFQIRDQFLLGSAAKARELLVSILNSEEQREFDRTGCVSICGKRHRYKITPGMQTELRSLTRGYIEGYACLQLTIPAPVHDRMIAEYLLIKNEEDSYLHTANLFHIYSRERKMRDFTAAVLCFVIGYAIADLFQQLVFLLGFGL
jgi:hypothetical protein